PPLSPVFPSTTLFRSRLVWPLRSMEVARASIRHARVVRREDVDLLFGRAWRVAVGGLFGNFGVLRTAKRGWISAYLTSRDAWVRSEEHTSELQSLRHL